MLLPLCSDLPRREQAACAATTVCLEHNCTFKLARRVEAVATQPDDLSSVPRTSLF